MINYKPKSGDMQLNMISIAIGEDFDLIDKMKRNEDGSFSILFSVGGVELDFNKVAKRISAQLNAKTYDEQIDKLVTDKAQNLLIEKYNDLLNEIIDIQERIEKQKEKFQYDWE